jgi:NAD(P)-dependent dehydrogenase (short-subunit alcohol dehydrogenase family)
VARAKGRHGVHDIPTYGRRAGASGRLNRVATWLVTGANRGIGLALVRQLHDRGDTVIATCRSSSPKLDAVGCRLEEGIDVGRDDVGARLDAALGPYEQLDVIVNNAGIGGWDSLERLDADLARRQFDVNTLGPLRVSLALLPRLPRGGKIGFVSSKAGSIGDHPSGGNYGYRISKSALNMAAANLARDLAPRGILVAVLHPGFVRTDMVGGAGDVDPADAAAGLIARLDELDEMRSGRFFHADGDEIPW